MYINFNFRPQQYKLKLELIKKLSEWIIRLFLLLFFIFVLMLEYATVSMWCSCVKWCVRAVLL